jgi:hypothetical protein
VTDLDLRAGVAVAAAAAVAALAVALVPRARVAASLAAVLAVVGAEWLDGVSRPLVATLPWAVVILGYCCFTHQSACEIGRPLRRLEPLLRR